MAYVMYVPIVKASVNASDHFTSEANGIYGMHSDGQRQLSANTLTDYI